MQALKSQVAELSASHATREEVQMLRTSSSKLTKKINNLETTLGGKGGSGSGLMQMHADFREQYKDKVKYLDGESMEHGHHIGNLLKEVASLNEQIQQHDEVSHTHGPLSPRKTSKK
jgi:prefoldin subunit 5